MADLDEKTARPDGRTDDGAVPHAAELLQGLSHGEVAERIAAGKVNVNTDLKTKSLRELALENVCTPFNALNLALAILVLITGSFKNLTFLGIVLLNTAIGIIQSWRSKRMVDRLTLLTSSRATVVRDGVETEIDLDQIVQDDLIKLGRGDQIPADAEVVAGDAQVNESLLTGESDLIRKQPGSQLMSGSFVDSGMVHARVVHVGAENYVARINNEAKYVKKVNSQIMRAINAIVRFSSVVMGPLGIALVLSSVSEAFKRAGSPADSVLSWIASGGVPWNVVTSSILSTLGALLGMVPQGLVLLTSSVLAIATVRLARRHVLAQQLYCIETLARVDVLCLDKTGTITSGRMEVAGVYVAEDDGSCVSWDRAEGERAAAVDFALANIAHATAADANETCKALLDYYGSMDVPLAQPRFVVPFSSAKKWSGAAFDEGAFIMGAAQFVLAPDELARVGDAVASLAATARVLVVARVDGFTDTGDAVGDARPLGFVAIRDEIRASAEQTIAYFREQGVTLNVISGDDPRTVSGIAAVVGIPGADAYVDATRLDTPAKIEAAVDRYHVFGRVTPQQKRELVCAMKARGHTVAMTGDGVNDVLALKEADCSVAMAAGSDAARNVAEIVLVDNDFASMPAVVAEGRRSINNLQRSAALFLSKTLFSMGLSALCIAFPPYPFEPITMSLINFFCIGAPSFVLALETNRARMQGNFLVNVLKRALPAGVAVVLSCSLCMGAGSIFALDASELSTMCLLATAIVGFALIWRISWPFTPLRCCLFAFITVGLFGAVILFPTFFSIAALSLPIIVLCLVNSVVGVVVMLALAEVLDRQQVRATRLATGFGRGVRVSTRAGSRRVTSTGSSVRRTVYRIRDRVREMRERRRESSAQAVAERAVVEREPASRGRRVAAASVVPAGKRRVSKTADGIHVKMPARSRRGGSRRATSEPPSRP